MVNLKTPETEKAFQRLYDSGIAFVCQASNVEAVIFNQENRYNYLPCTKERPDYDPELSALVAEKRIKKKDFPPAMHQYFPSNYNLVIEGYADAVRNHMIHNLLNGTQKYEILNPLKNERIAGDIIQQDECDKNDRNSIFFKESLLVKFIDMIKETVDQNGAYPHFSQELETLSQSAQIMTQAYHGFAQELKPVIARISA